VASFGTTQQQIFSDIGYFRGVLVALKHIRKEHIQLTRTVLLEFNEVCNGTLEMEPIYDRTLLQKRSGIAHDVKESQFYLPLKRLFTNGMSL